MQKWTFLCSVNHERDFPVNPKKLSISNDISKKTVLDTGLHKMCDQWDL